MNLFPFLDVLASAKEAVAGGTARVFQQFNCAGCGTKQTMDEPNIFYTKGECQECGGTTDIWKDGCNQMLMIGPPVPGTKEPVHGRRLVIIGNVHGKELEQKLVDLGIGRRPS